MRQFFATLSIFCLLLCAMSSFLWLRSIARNNYWDRLVIRDVGGFPPIYMAILWAIFALLLGVLWHRERAHDRRSRQRGFAVLQRSN